MQNHHRQRPFLLFASTICSIATPENNDFTIYQLLQLKKHSIQILHDVDVRWTLLETANPVLKPKKISQFQTVLYGYLYTSSVKVTFLSVFSHSLPHFFGARISVFSVMSVQNSRFHPSIVPDKRKL